MNNYIDEIIKLANKSLNNKDIPVGAIIVKNNLIISIGYNTRVKNNDPIGHAEVIAIKNACKYLNDWRLNGCDLYVTLEPCDMCLEIIKEVRINNIYYLVSNEEKHKYNKTNVRVLNNCNKYKKVYKDILTNFFKDNLNRGK